MTSPDQPAVYERSSCSIPTPLQILQMQTAEECDSVMRKQRMAETETEAAYAEYAVEDRTAVRIQKIVSNRLGWA